MTKFLASLITFVLIFNSSVSLSSAQSNYVPAIFLTSDAKQVVSGNPINLTLVANTLGTVFRHVEAYIVLEGDPVPNEGYTYSITPKADERLDVSIYEEISGENSHIIHIMVTSPFQEGVNWGSEAVPIVNLRFIPQTAGSIKAYLSDESGVSYNNQESIRYDNYTPFSRPYLMAVVDLNARPTLTPRATSSPWPTATPTFSPAPTPNYEEEYQNLKLQVDNLQNKVEIQEQRLTFLEAVIMRIKRFFANIFSFGL